MRFAKVGGFLAVAAAVLTTGASAFNVIGETLPDGIVGTPYSYQIKWDTGAPPFSFSFLTGVLPPGLKVETGGKITGTPTQAGTYKFDINGSQCCGQDSQGSFTLTILEKLTVTTEGLKSATAGVPYSAMLAATVPSSLKWTVSAGALPAGLTLATNGTISGTPTVAGSSTFTVKVQDRDGFGPRTDTKQLTLLVAAPLVAALPPGGLPPAVVGKPFTAPPFAATGGVPHYTWSLAGGTLPPGLVLDPVTGALSGIPTTPGNFPFTVGLADAEGRTATLDLTVTVARALELVTKRVRGARVDRDYSAKLRARGGLPPRTWQVVRGKLPPGLQLDPATGVISGTPERAGIFSFWARVTDSLGGKSVRKLTLTVRA